MKLIVRVAWFFIVQIACALSALAQGPEFVLPFALSPYNIHLAVGQSQSIQVLDAHGRPYTPAGGWSNEPTLRIEDTSVISYISNDCMNCGPDVDIPIVAKKPGRTPLSVVVGGSKLSVNVTVHAGSVLPPGTVPHEVAPLLTNSSFSPIWVPIKGIVGDEYRVFEERGAEGSVLRAFTVEDIQTWIWPNPWNPVVAPQLTGLLEVDFTRSALAQLVDHETHYTVAIDYDGMELWRHETGPWLQMGTPKIYTFATVEEDSRGSKVAVYSSQTGRPISTFPLPISHYVHRKLVRNSKFPESACREEILDSKTPPATAGAALGFVSMSLYLPLTTNDSWIEEGNCLLGPGTDLLIHRSVELQVFMLDGLQPSWRLVQKYGYEGSDPNAAMDWIEAWGGRDQWWHTDQLSLDDGFFFVAKKSRVRVGDLKELSSHAVIYRIDDLSSKQTTLREIPLNIPVATGGDSGELHLGPENAVLYSNNEALQVADINTGKIRWTYHAMQKMQVIGFTKKGDVVIETNGDQFWLVGTGGKLAPLSSIPELWKEVN